MSPGYGNAPSLLSLDHRHSCVTGMFGFEPPLTQAQHAHVADSKRVVYEEYMQALAGGVARDTERVA